MNTSLKISTYNIQHGTNSQKIINNIELLAQSGVDIFCLQEIRHHPNKPFIVDTLLNVLGKKWKAECLISSSTFDLGLCIIWDSAKLKAKSFNHVFLPKLSKVKLYEKIYLKVHRKLEKVSSKNIGPEVKAALIGEFKFFGNDLRVTNTHLDWLGGSKHRAAQLKHIKNHLSLGQPRIFEIICGDFNTLGHYKFGKRLTKKIKTLLGQEFLSVFESKPTTKSWQVLDHILVKNLRVIQTEILKLKGSDHYPLMAEVKI